MAGGHGCTPMLFNVNGNGEISFVSKLEEDKKTGTETKFSAKALFQTRDKMGVSDVADTVLNTTHQNQVSNLFVYFLLNRKSISWLPVKPEADQK